MNAEFKNPACTASLFNNALRFVAKHARSVRPVYHRINEYFYQYISERYPQVLTETETMNMIVSGEKMSIARYGDGEFKLCRNKSIARQRASAEISCRLREILQCDVPRFAVAVPPRPDKTRIVDSATQHYYRKFYFREWESVHRMKNRTYLSSWVFKPHNPEWLKLSPQEAPAYTRLFRKLWDNRNVVFVTNSTFNEHPLFTEMFGNAKSQSFIHVPGRNAYSRYNDILRQCLSYSAGNLFLLACGPTATILAYDLATKGYQAVDLGSCL